MVGTFQPLVENQKIIEEDGRPSQYFIRFIQQKQNDIGEAVSAAEAEEIAIAAIEVWAAARDINAGTGLSGGGNLSSDITIDLENTAVTPGSYTNTNITVDAQGRITAASNGTGGGVASVTGTAPIVSSGGATPAISITAASGSSAGSMSSADKTKLDALPSDFNEAVDDRVATLIVAGTGISVTYNDVSNTLTIASVALSKFPLVDGSVPPNLVYEEDGSLVYVEI